MGYRVIGKRWLQGVLVSLVIIMMMVTLELGKEGDEEINLINEVGLT